MVVQPFIHTTLYKILQVSSSLKLESLIDHIVKNVDECVLNKSVIYFIELESKCSKTFWDFCNERMRSLLIFFVGGDELVVQTK